MNNSDPFVSASPDNSNDHDIDDYDPYILTNNNNNSSSSNSNRTSRSESAYKFFLESAIMIISAISSAVLRLSLNQFNRLILPVIQALVRISYYFIYLNLVRPQPIPISSSSDPINPSFPFYDPNKNRQHSKSKSNYNLGENDGNNNLSLVLITHNSDLNEIPLELALNLASSGYHVFLQVSTQSQLTQVIINWQRLKSKLNHRLSSENRKNNRTLLRASNNYNTNNPSSFSQQHLRFRPSSSLTDLSESSFRFYSHPNRNHSDYGFYESNDFPTSQSNDSELGTIMPLLYQTYDVSSRLLAISTINAYARENSMDMFSLINIITPHQVKKSFNPLASLTPTSPCFQPVTSPTSNYHSNSNHHRTSISSQGHGSPDSCRPLTGLSSPPLSGDPSSSLPYPTSPTNSRTLPLMSNSNPFGGGGDNSYNEFYSTNPKILPLSINSEVFISDCMNEILISPILIVQDLLPLLKSHSGRVINVWDDNNYNSQPHQNLLRRSSGNKVFKNESFGSRLFDDFADFNRNGLIGIMMNGFEKISKTLNQELRPSKIPISIIYAPFSNSRSKLKRMSKNRLRKLRKVDLNFPSNNNGSSNDHNSSGRRLLFSERISTGLNSKRRKEDEDEGVESRILNKITCDSRSILTDSSDPELLKVFIDQIEVNNREDEIYNRTGLLKPIRLMSKKKNREEINNEEEEEEGQEESDEIIGLIRSNLETNYPIKKYPIEIFDVLKEINSFLLVKVSSVLRFLLK